MRYCFSALAASLLIVVVSTLGCDQPQELTPLVYTAQYNQNVSTVIQAKGTARQNLSDAAAPDFSWHRADGTIDSLRGHRGKVVVLNFWATWCGYCVNEMPDLDSISQMLGDSVYVIGVATDNQGNVFQTVQSFVNDHNIRYQIVIDSDYAIYNRYLLYSTTGIPQSFIIDTAGRARFQLPGQQSRATFLTYIRKAE